MVGYGTRETCRPFVNLLLSFIRRWHGRCHARRVVHILPQENYLEGDTELKSRLVAVLMLTALLGASSLSAAARTPPPQSTPGIDRREHRQQRRIRRGYRRGSLTRREAARLERREAGVRRAEWRARADGRVTRGERRRINRRLNRLNRGIYRQRHDRQHR